MGTSPDERRTRYTDQQAREVIEQDPATVAAYYAQLAAQQRPAVERAIAALSGKPRAVPE